MIGTCGIIILEAVEALCDDGIVLAGALTKDSGDREWGVLCVHSRGRGHRADESFRSHTRDHFGRNATPGNDSPTANSRPVLATDASTVAVSSGFTDRRSTDLNFETFTSECFGGRE